MICPPIITGSPSEYCGLNWRFNIRKEAHARDFIQLKEEHARDFTQLKEEHLREREHWQARLSADGENFRLQIENLVLRMQRGLPLPELPQKPEDE